MNNTDIKQPLEDLVKEYLTYGSCDGRPERSKLREQMAEAIGVPYNTKTHMLGNPPSRKLKTAEEALKGL